MAISWKCLLAAVCCVAQVDRGSTHSGSTALDGEYAATHTSAASKIDPLISLFAPARLTLRQRPVAVFPFPSNTATSRRLSYCAPLSAAAYVPASTVAWRFACGERRPAANSLMAFIRRVINQQSPVPASFEPG